MTRPTPDPMDTHRLLKINHAWRRVALYALTLGVIILIVGSIGAALITLSDRSTLAAANRALRVIGIQQDRQHYQLLQACRRLNVQRASINLSSYADYLVDRVVLSFSSPTAASTTRERSFERSFLPQLHYAVRVKGWTPLTNCTHAVAVSGAAFKAAPSIPFTVQRPPPSALDSTNAQLSVPVGSR